MYVDDYRTTENDIRDYLGSLTFNHDKQDQPVVIIVIGGFGWDINIDPSYCGLMYDNDYRDNTTDVRSYVGSLVLS